MGNGKKESKKLFFSWDRAQQVLKALTALQVTLQQLRAERLIWCMDHKFSWGSKVLRNSDILVPAESEQAADFKLLVKTSVTVVWPELTLPVMTVDI